MRLKLWSAIGIMLLTGCAATATNPNSPISTPLPPGPDSPISMASFAAPIKVACVGDSTTYGYGITQRARNSYPAQLGTMLGPKWQVQNFGFNSATLLKNGDVPYVAQKPYKDALAFKPDVVVIMLGTNDVKAVNWEHKDQFASDYKALIETFAALESKPRIFVCHPCPAPNGGNWGITEAGLAQEWTIITGVITEEKTGMIDIHTALAEQRNMFQTDNIHPNPAGAGVMAKTVFKALTGKEFIPAATAPATQAK